MALRCREGELKTLNHLMIGEVSSGMRKEAFFGKGVEEIFCMVEGE